MEESGTEAVWRRGRCICCAARSSPAHTASVPDSSIVAPAISPMVGATGRGRGGVLGQVVSGPRAPAG
eukprot:819547-Lingulodinium_polyedra.AAC.1